MRILEISAGTGSATVEVLKSIAESGRPTYSKYTWSNISPTFVGEGQEKFKQHKNIEYRVLDISKSPKDQGFPAQEYDLIIASNVLHATPSLHQTLLHTQELLSPNSRLLLHKLNPDLKFINLCMWIGSQDFQADAPYVSPDRWNSELQNAGFTGIEAAVNDMDPPFQCSYTMISRLANTDPVKSGVTLLDLGCKFSQKMNIEGFFAELGYEVEFSTINEPPQPSDWVILLDIEGSFLRTMSPTDFNAIRKYMSSASGCKIVWATKGIHFDCSNPDFGLALGFARTLRKELRLDLATLEVDTFDSNIARYLERILRKMSLEKSSFVSGPDYEFRLHGGCLHVGRYFWGPLENSLQPSKLSTDLSQLQIRTPGLLNTLEWKQVNNQELGDNDVEVEMHYLGLNFKDVMVAMGLVGTKDEIGLEGSGIIRNVESQVTCLAPGHRVMVIGLGIFRTRVVVNRRACVKVPSGMSLEEAGGTISIFATAQYALISLAQLEKGQSVLIHSACGGVGLAAIQICKAIGAEIYATVGTQEKIEYLTQDLEIPPERIFDSRSASFKPALMKITNGRGVDVVLNSLAGELLHSSWECVAPFGKFIELGKRDMLTNGMLNLNPFLKNRAFFGLDMNAVLEPGLTKTLERFSEQFQRWWQEGKVKPIARRTVFAADQAPEAFRTLQKGAHIGKILLKLPECGQVIQAKPMQQAATFATGASYLLVGGFGGIGRAVATWLVERGARYLTILSRSAGVSSDDKSFIWELEAQGCRVQSVAGDVADPKDVRRALAACEGRLKGVLQMSLCLQDESYASMTFEQWSAALAPKVLGTWNLHDATVDFPLDFFVVFGSMSGVCGNEGQANYAAANSFLGAFASYRRGLGLPASALDLGAVGETGLISRNSKLIQGMRATDIFLLNEAEVLKGLEVAIVHSRSPLTTSSGAMLEASYLIGAQHTRPMSDPMLRPLWIADARFASYRQLESASHEEPTKKTTSKIKKILAEAQKDPSIVHRQETAGVVSQEVSELVTMHLPEAEDMSHEEKLMVQIDSLMAIEVRNWIRRTLNLEVRLGDIGRAKTVGGLTELLSERLKAKFPVDEVAPIDGRSMAQAST